MTPRGDTAIVESLRGTLGKLELSLGAIPDAIVWADESGAIQWCNAAFDRLTGRGHLELLSRPLPDVLPLERGGAPMPPEESPLRRARDPGCQDTRIYDYRASSGTRSLEVTAVRVAFDERERSVVLVLHDVTERRRTEAQLEAAHANLQAAYKELESFCHSMAHDLRAPLRTISGFCELLAEKHAGKLGPEADQDFRRILDAGRRMNKLIDGLLALARQSRKEPRREAVDLSALAQTLAAELRKSDPQRRVELVIAPGLKTVGDLELLGVALRNLLDNAWKFTSKRADARVEVGTAVREGRRAFFVKDNGAGFDMAYVGKLFVPFQRLHHVSEYPGTGIGLATAQRIVERHGGRLWAEAEAGKGATFYFTLETP